MTKIFALAWKDTLLRFASRSELLFFIILPLVFTFILGGGFNPGQADSRVRVLVVDEAGSALAREVLDALAASTAVRPDVQPRAAAEEQFTDRQAAALLIIPAGFAQGGELELRQQPNNLNAQVAERAVRAVIGRVGQALTVAASSTAEAESRQPFAAAADRQAYFDAALAQAETLFTEAPARVTVTRATTQDPVDYDPAANASAGQLITWVFIPLLGLSGLFAFERQQGTLRRLLVTPTQRGTLLAGTIAGQVTLALVQMTLLVVCGAVFMGLGWARAPLGLALLMVAFALAAAALGTALGTFVKSENQASGLSMMLGMAMALLGGCWYPIELFPEAVRTAAKLLPTTWAMQGLLDLVLRGQDVPGVLLEAGVLAGFAAVFFAVGVARFRYE
ncbi:MAG: ABC transporter permease [Anaerolineales bacterium]|nr:ABC transporter permease [Anaerolineales bacterium]